MQGRAEMEESMTEHMQFLVMQIREDSMTSSVMQHLMAVPVVQVALTLAAWIWVTYSVIFLEISLAAAVQEVRAMVL